jgi:DNA repair photolyase
MEAVELLPKVRRGRILTPADFGCLKGIPTLNVTQGCLFQCAYCYARGYRDAPGKGKVHLYVNLPRLLEEELLKKRVLPPWVILNTSSDCFQPHPDILDVTWQVMKLLLDHGVGLSFLTKGIIPERFLRLMEGFPEKILAQIGLVSLSPLYWRKYEPGTPSSEGRLKNIQRLKQIGVFPEIRMDPIVPFVTDVESELKRLFEQLESFEVKRVTVSYLHLRPAIRDQLLQELPPIHQKLITPLFETQEWKTIGSSTKTKLLPRTLRERGYQRIKETAKEFGITVIVCQCKNPDLEADICSPGTVRKVSRKTTPIQLPLFKC